MEAGLEWTAVGRWEAGILRQGMWPLRSRPPVLVEYLLQVEYLSVSKASPKPRSC